MAKSFPFNEAKFAELLVHLARRCADDPGFGATKLHKLLFFIDFEAFAELGSPVTGADYQRLEHGPAARQCLPVQGRLEREGAVRLEQRPVGARHTQKRLVSLRPPDDARFEASELRIIERVVTRLWNMSAAEVSELAHRHSGWGLSYPNALIPYFSQLVPKAPIELTAEQRTREEQGISRIIQEAKHA